MACIILPMRSGVLIEDETETETEKWVWLCDCVRETERKEANIK